MKRPIPEGLRMVIDDAHAEGDREERESGVEVRRVLRRVRHKPARTTVLPSRPLGLYDAGLDYPEVDDDLTATPITDPSRANELPEAGCDLADLKAYLYDPNARLEEIARMALDACQREKYARSFAEIRAAERDKLIARDLFIAAVSDTVAVNQHARVEA